MVIHFSEDVWGNCMLTTIRIPGIGENEYETGAAPIAIICDISFNPCGLVPHADDENSVVR